MRRRQGGSGAVRGGEAGEGGGAGARGVSSARRPHAHPKRWHAGRSHRGCIISLVPPTAVAHRHRLEVRRPSQVLAGGRLLPLLVLRPAGQPPPADRREAHALRPPRNLELKITTLGVSYTGSYQTPIIVTSAWVFCVSWCSPDFEFRGADPGNTSLSYTTLGVPHELV